MIRLVQSCVDLPPYENRVVNIVKAKHDLRTKQDAILFIIKEYGKQILDEKYMLEEDPTS